MATSLWRGGVCWSIFRILSSGQCACRPTWRYPSLLDECYCIYAFHALWVCLHSCVMGLRKRGGIIQQRWHAQSPGPYQYLPPDTAGKIRRLVPWNINHSQEGLRGNCAWNKNSETFRVLIPGPGDPPKDPATTAERWLLKLISYFIYLFRKFPVSLPILHCAITSPYTKPVFNYSYYMLPQQLKKKSLLEFLWRVSRGGCWSLCQLHLGEGYTPWMSHIDYKSMLLWHLHLILYSTMPIYQH